MISSITYPNTITVTNAYEANRDLVDYVENKYGSTVISKYDYTNDAIGRRTSMGKSGTAFTAVGTITYSYNDHSEVISADATTDANYNFVFDYDNIGNRKSYTSSESGTPVQSIYTSNNLNQYTAITNPTKSPVYDDDGNMLNDGTWTFTYNAENRIVVAEKSDVKLEFQYDYAGRRVEKKVYSGSSGNWILTKHLKFVYNGYEQIEELDGANNDAILKKHIWGNGKIITDIHGTTAYYALGDANKNITEYIDSTGTIQAHYEYSPFGKITKKTGSKQNNFDYRFSSEVLDSESGLVYYNFRYYSPSLGRWLNRDPIEEYGGYNLYEFVSNDGINQWDHLGLRCCSPEEIQMCVSASIKAFQCGAKFLETLSKYDPVSDYFGGHPYFGGTRFTKPGEHYKKLKNYAKCIKNNLSKALKCSDCDNFKPPAIPKRTLDRIANRPIPKPVRVPVPWWARGGAWLDSTIKYTGYACYGVGGAAITTIGVITAPVWGPAVLATAPATAPAAIKLVPQLAY